jgi:hypothetical protein
VDSVIVPTSGIYLRTVAEAVEGAECMCLGEPSVQCWEVRLSGRIAAGAITLSIS